jgi:hypothetical protein
MKLIAQLTRLTPRGLPDRGLAGWRALREVVISTCGHIRNLLHLSAMATPAQEDFPGSLAASKWCPLVCLRGVAAFILLRLGENFSFCWTITRTR